MPPKRTPQPPPRPVRPPARLDSLSRAGAATGPSAAGSAAGAGSATVPGPAGLKFKPKLVARRPKEERDATAPIAPPPPLPPSASSARGSFRGGRGSNRGGRGGLASNTQGQGAQARMRFEPVSTAAAGPFAEPLFGDPRALVGRTSAFERRAPTDSVGVSGSRLYSAADLGARKSHVKADVDGKAHDGEEHEEDGADESDEDAVREGIERIDIAKVSVSNLNGSDIAHFVPLRDEPTATTAINADDAVEVVIDEDAMHVQERARYTNVLADVDTKDAEDGIDVEDLRRQIERQLFLFQLPPVLPRLAANNVKSEPGVKTDVKTSPEDKKVKPEPDVATPPVADDGLVGRLYVHKSGKITIRWGGIEMEVARGAESDFLQDVVVVDDTNGLNRATLLGHIARKVVVSPNIDALLAHLDTE
ncbi:RNA polymerase III RPC4-domain-containing protein [Limtongia smithiae]|uniref:RNA polymerase III RPC4-domain-containing protein n=1 Tax=Limtongia smithiae TaxID=1125753 RepID=UPI0034CF85AD